MHYLARVALASMLLLSVTPQEQVNANDFRTKSLTRGLEYALNKKEINYLKNFLASEDETSLINRYKSFVNAFPNAQWSIKECNTLKDGRTCLKIQITGIKDLNGERYTLKSKQIVGLTIASEKIIRQDLINEETVIQLGEKPLSISLNIPDTVLTGEVYDFDVILNKPLGNALVAGGLIPISDQQILNQKSPNIELIPLGGGGLFKSVKAPLKKGIQKWAAVVAHPNGLISITKMVRVVSNSEEVEL